MANSSDDNRALVQAVHDVGSALWFGGSVFGFAAVNKCGEDLKDPLDRIRVANSAWKRYGPVEWAGLLANIVAGLILTASSRRRLALQEGFGRAGSVKILMTLAGTAATFYAARTGRRVGELNEQAAREGRSFDVKDATIPTQETPQELADAQRRQRIAQWLVPTFSGANLVLNSYLVQAYRPGASLRGLLGKLSPR